MKQQRSLTPVSQASTALVPSNPAVQTVANALGWKPTTLVARAQRALPSALEQSLYALICEEEWEPLHPESFAKMLAVFIYGQEFSAQNDAERLSYRLLHDEGLGLGEFLENCLALLGKIDREDSHSISVTTVAKLVWAYDDEAEAIVEMIETNLDDLAQAAGWRLGRSFPTARAVAKIADIIANHAIGQDTTRGMPNVVSAEEAVALLSKFPTGLSDYNQDEFDA